MEVGLVVVVILALIFVGCPLIIYFAHRLILTPWLVRKYPGISPLFAWQRVQLLRKEQLTQTEEPVFRLTFALPPGRRLHADLSVGEFIRVKKPGLGKPRSYSPTQVNVQGEFELCVKRYKQGCVSVHLCDAAVGDYIIVSGPYPPFWIPLVRAGVARRVGLIAFGVGITEALPLARLELENDSSVEVRLLWANRCPDEVFDRASVEELQARYAGRFDVQYIFSRAPGWEGTLNGRVTSEVLMQTFGSWQKGSEAVRFLVVGTRRMKQDAYSLLQGIGFNAKLLRRRPCGCCCRKPRAKAT